MAFWNFSEGFKKSRMFPQGVHCLVRSNERLPCESVTAILKMMVEIPDGTTENAVGPAIENVRALKFEPSSGFNRD